MRIRESQRPLNADARRTVSPVVTDHRELDVDDGTVDDEVVTLLRRGNKRVILEGEACALVYEALQDEKIVVEVPVQMLVTVKKGKVTDVRLLPRESDAGALGARSTVVEGVLVEDEREWVQRTLWDTWDDWGLVGQMTVEDNGHNRGSWKSTDRAVQWEWEG